MSKNSLGCKSSLSSNLISEKHNYSRLLFHISDSFVNPSSNHTLKLHPKCAENFNVFLYAHPTPQKMDQGLSDLVLCQGPIR